MSEVTRILSRIEHGDREATEQLLPLVYEELRKLATAKLSREKPGQTLQATALVHEAYIRLIGGERLASWESKGHFFSAAAEAMRRILINRARDRGRLKRGGNRKRIDFDLVTCAVDTPAEELFAIDEAIESLLADDPIGGQLVKLKYFAGLSLRESAEQLGIARRTADRHWAFARARLVELLS